MPCEIWPAYLKDAVAGSFVGFHDFIIGSSRLYDSWLSLMVPARNLLYPVVTEGGLASQRDYSGYL